MQIVLSYRVYLHFKFGKQALVQNREAEWKIYSSICYCYTIGGSTLSNLNKRSNNGADLHADWIEMTKKYIQPRINL